MIAIDVLAWAIAIFIGAMAGFVIIFGAIKVYDDIRERIERKKK